MVVIEARTGEAVIILPGRLFLVSIMNLVASSISSRAPAPGLSFEVFLERPNKCMARRQASDGCVERMSALFLIVLLPFFPRYFQSCLVLRRSNSDGEDTLISTLSGVWLRPMAGGSRKRFDRSVLAPFSAWRSLYDSLTLGCGLMH